MNYKIQNRLENILTCDKIGDTQSICEVIKDEIKPIIENYLTLQKDISVRFKKENNKNIFFIEIQAERTRPFGYIPY